MAQGRRESRRQAEGRTHPLRAGDDLHCCKCTLPSPAHYRLTCTQAMLSQAPTRAGRAGQVGWPWYERWQRALRGRGAVGAHGEGRRASRTCPGFRILKREERRSNSQKGRTNGTVVSVGQMVGGGHGWWARVVGTGGGHAYKIRRGMRGTPAYGNLDREW